MAPIRPTLGNINASIYVENWLETTLQEVINARYVYVQGHSHKCIKNNSLNETYV